MISQLYAMAPNPGAGGDAPSPIISMLPIVAVVVLGYFMLIRPQQKTQNERNELLKALKEGDEVITVSGVYGRIYKISDDDTVMLKISENTTIKVTRQAIERPQKK
jgi:preprotein translocase subunit YajC